MSVTTENMETMDALRARLLDEGVRDPATLASAAMDELRRERKRAGSASWNIVAEDLDKLVELALKRNEELEAAVEKKAASRDYGMF